MMVGITKYGFIIVTLLCAIYSQIVMKWQIGLIPVDKLSVFGLMAKLINWWVFSAAIAVAVGALSWIYVLSKFELSYAYNFISLLFPFMVIAGVVFFNEPLKSNLLIGSLLILIGVTVISR